jgi:cell division protein FtsW
MNSYGPDKTLIFVVLALMLTGLVMVYSSSYRIAIETTRAHDASFFLRNHLLRVMLGLILMYVFTKAGESPLRAMAKPLMILSIGLLFLTVVPNPLRSCVRGSCRWLKAGPFSFQPSELAKIALILYVADFATRKGEKMKDFARGFVPAFAVIGVAATVTALEPNVGTAGMLLLIGSIVLFAGGARIVHLAAGLGGSAGLILLIMRLTGYNWARFGPTADISPRGIGYQLWQSLIAIGAGGLKGVGIGMSNQKYLFVPDAHTDFVFAIMAEEIGFLGLLGIIGLFFIFVWRGLRVAKRAQTGFSSILAVGITMSVAAYFCANAGVCTGLLPTAGLPLPFMSYGGTSSMILLASCGMLLGVSRRQPNFLDLQPARWRALVR